MKLIKVAPVNNSVRHFIKLEKSLLTKKNNIVKNLFKHFILKKGRSNTTGHITVRHKGGGCKRKLHVLNSLTSYFGFNICQMYSSSHNAFISLNFDIISKSFFKTISTKNTYPGTILVSSKKRIKRFSGYRMQLRLLPIGSVLHLVGPATNSIYSNSAGTFCQLLEKKKTCKIRLPSGNTVHLPDTFFGTLGVVSNVKYKNIVIGKAGRNRLLGIRPSVRGIAMNPVDHPHGGRTNGGIPSVTPWGIPTKGKPTVKKKFKNLH